MSDPVGDWGAKRFGDRDGEVEPAVRVRQPIAETIGREALPSLDRLREVL